MKICFDCKKELPLNEYHSNGNSSTGKARLKPRCISCNYIYEVGMFANKLRRVLRTEYKCMSCGYDKCVAALEFHHLDPTTKDRPISQMKNYSEARLKIEVEKCVVLCCLCHREYHAGIRELPSK